MSDNIIVDWLKSVRLELYTQAFLDNGYDELEVCKQIGEADLDAIGVHNGVHREILLKAVTRLREEGGTSVYFTLENTDVQPKSVKNGSEQSKSVKLGTRSASTRRGLPKAGEDVPYKTLEQLRKYVGDKLVKDGIDLACPPYVKPDNAACHSSLAALAVKYTDQLKGASLQDVYRCLEELSMWRINGPHHYYSTAMPPVQPGAVINSHVPYASQAPPHPTSVSGHSPYARTGHAQFGGSCQTGHSPYASSVQTGLSNYASSVQSVQSNYASSGQVSHSPYASASQTCHSPYASSSQAPVHVASYPVYASSGQAPSCTMSQPVYGSPGTQPPPIPSSLPPATSHVEKSIDLHSVHTRYIYDNTGFQADQRAEDFDGKDDDKKKSSTLGRFFRNIGLRRSGKKHSYKPHKGDPNAYDITMDDDDRMALMLMVKEGKITTEHALQVVKKYEEERRKDLEQREKAFKRKKKQTRPVKSPSATYTGSVPRCDVCSGFKGSPHDLGYPTGNVCVDPTHQLEYSQHRRVHSVGHIDHAYSSRSPEGTRSLNCTPTHCAMSRSSAVSTPVSFYSPGHHPKLYSPVFPQDARLSLYQCRACSHHNSPMSTGAVTGRCHTALGVRVSQSESSPGVNMTRDDLSPGGEASRSGSCVDHSPSTTSFDLVSSESEHSIDCQSHGHPPYNATPSHRESSHYLSSTGAISTNPRDRNRSPQVQGVWQKNAAHRDTNSRNHGKENLVIGASPKSASSESNHSNHSADSSGLCSYRSASPNAGQTVVPVDQVSGCGQVSYVQAHSDFVPTSNSRDALTLQKGDVIRVLYKPPGDLWRGVLKGKTGWFRVSCVEPLYTGETALEPWLDRRPNKPKTVQEVLQVIGLESLEAVFIQNGFDELDCFADVDEEDLDLLGIFDPLIRTKLLSTADLIKNTQDTPTLHWKFHQGRAGPPVAFLNKEYRHGTSYPPSQDSGCYASFEHLAQRDAYPTTNELKQQYCLHSNKENISPGARAGAPGLGITRPQRGHSGVGSSENSEDLDRSDKEYTAEDREVSEITNSVDCNTTSKATTNDLSELSSDAVIMCNFAGTQTSPTYGRANCDNSVNNLSSPHIRQSSSTNGDFVSSSQSQEGPVGSPLHSAPPFPRKCVPRQDWNFRDVQVQVMCPLGSLNLNAEGVQDGEGVPTHPHTAHNTPPTSLVLSNPRHTDNGVYRSVSRPDDGGYRSVSQLSRRSMSADRASVKRTKPEDPPEYRTVMRSLLSLITSKLVSENIDLALEPYSTKTGECGIPPLLVQRYADELRQDLVSVALVVDQIRVQQLCGRHRPAVLSRDLPDSAAKACEIKISSIPEFFTSIGLPMYTNMFLEEKMAAMEDLLQLNFEDIRDITRTHAKHVKRISHALEWVRTRISTLRKTSNKDAAVMDRV